MKFRLSYFVPLSAVTSLSSKKVGVRIARCSVLWLRKLARPQFLAGNCGGTQSLRFGHSSVRQAHGESKQFSTPKIFDARCAVAGLGIAVIFTSPVVVSAQVIISEIMYDAPDSDAKAEWIELQNIGAKPVDISKWKINDGANHVLNAPPKNGSTGSLVLPSGSFLILASDATSFVASRPDASVSVIDSTFSLSNTGDTISILDASSTLVDNVSYTSSRGGSGTGESLQLIGGELKPAKPTPGAENSSVRIPKPVAASPAKKTTTKKTTTKTKTTVTHNLEEAETPETLINPEDAATSSDAMQAAAVVPVNSESRSYMPWAYGALALGVAGASAVVVARQKKKGEWDIEEIV